MRTKRMNKLSLLIGLLVLVGSILPYSSTAQCSLITEKLNELSDGKIKISSKVLGEERVASVFLPMGYEQSAQNYPVLYLLDGRTHFRHATAAVDYLSDRGLIPQMIIVAVHNVDRTRDFSPVAVKEQANTGGAKKFLSYLSDELNTHIKKNYRTSDFTVLMGHSFGGTFASYALLAKPELFDGYIAVSPFLMYADNHMVIASKEKLKAKYSKEKFFYMTVGNEPNYFKPLDEYATAMKTKSGKAIKFKYDKFEGENHGTTPYLSLFHGLKFVYADWQLTRETMAKGVTAMDKHYKMVSLKYGFNIKTSENQINALGYTYIQNKEFDKAIVVFKENVKRFPKSANVYDSLGEAYENNKQLKLAKKNYEMAYKLGKENGDRNTAVFKTNFERMQKAL